MNKKNKYNVKKELVSLTTKPLEVAFCKLSGKGVEAKDSLGGSTNNFRWKVVCKVPVNSPEGKEIATRVKEVWEDYKKYFKDTYKQEPKLKNPCLRTFFSLDGDERVEDKDFYSFTAKRKVLEKRIKIVDSNKKECSPDLAIGAGSKVRLNVLFRAGSVNSGDNSYVSVTLLAVQVLDLVEGQGGGDFFDEDSGFSGGWVSSKDKDPVAKSDEEKAPSPIVDDFDDDIPF